MPVGNDHVRCDLLRRRWLVESLRKTALRDQLKLDVRRLYERDLQRFLKVTAGIRSFAAAGFARNNR